MATPSQNSQDPLCQEILAEARCQSEQVICRARQEADARLATAAADVEKARQEQLALAHTEAVRRKALILATVPVEAGRLRAARIEALLQAIYAEARRRLADRYDFDYRKTLVVLAAEAISRMAGEAFLVKLSAPDHAAFGEGLAHDIALRVGRSSLSITISNEPTITESGLLVQDLEGRQFWDNRLPARLERLWPELRRQLAVQLAFVAADLATSDSRSTQDILAAPKALVPSEQHSDQEDRKSRVRMASPCMVANSNGGAK